MGARKQRIVVREADIIPDYAPPRRGRGNARWSERSKPMDERRPANEWVPPEPESPAPEPHHCAVCDTPPVPAWPLDIIYGERPAYALDEPPSQTVR